MANIGEYFRQQLAAPDTAALSPLRRRGVARRQRRRGRRTHRPLAGGVRSARASPPAIASRSASGTASTGSRSIWLRSAWAWSSCRCTSTTTPTTSRGASRTRRRGCSSSTTRRWRTRSSATAGELPPIYVLRADDGRRRPRRWPRFLPAAADAPEFRVAAGCHAGDDLLHLGHGGPAEGRDAVARQHHRQRRRRASATGMARPTDLFLSILPLSHMFERTGGYYLPLSIGARVVFARGVAAARRGPRVAGAHGHVRGAADLREILRAASSRRSPHRR